MLWSGFRVLCCFNGHDCYKEIKQTLTYIKIILLTVLSVFWCTEGIVISIPLEDQAFFCC